MYGTRGVPGDAAVHNRGAVHRAGRRPVLVRDRARMRTRRWVRARARVVVLSAVLAVPTAQAGRAAGPPKSEAKRS
ncbi:hypothetical protein GCM10023177_61280 [Streptomyces violaceoruber]